MIQTTNTEEVLKSNWKKYSIERTNYFEKGNFDKALEFSKKEVDEAKKTYSENSIFYASSIYNQAQIYKNIPDFKEVERLLTIAKPLFEKLVSNNGSLYTKTIADLAELYCDTKLTTSSWPGLTRPPTFLVTARRKERRGWPGQAWP